MLTKTETVQWGKRGTVDGEAPSALPGIVLLYAKGFARLPAAVPLTEHGLVIGRAPPPGGLCLPDNAVSQLHARVLRHDGVWTVKDLGSRNGTLVGGSKVSTAPLHPFDVLHVGETLFGFLPDDAGAYARYRIDGALVDGDGLKPDPAIIGGYRVRSLIRELSAVAATELSVLVSGETGTGKELIARAVHRASGRRGSFVALNCAALPANLIESELFGFKRGAFTGADRDKPGLVRAAHTGTLFLDEVGDMPLEAQAKLLRVLEAREVLPVGATRGEPVDVRFVSATHRDLQELVDNGRFRGDLFARLRGATVRLPPLRERKEDLYCLIMFFLQKMAAAEARVGFSFMAGICRYDWPYNVRELEAAVRRAIATATGPELTGDDLPENVRALMQDYGQPKAASVRPPRSGAPSPEELRALLERFQGNVAAVGRELGRDRAQIHRWMRYAGIDPETYRS